MVDGLDVILQMENVSFSSLFNEDYRKTFPENSNFIKGNCSINYETHIAVHWDLQLILYFYLVDNLTEEIKELVSLLKSDTINEIFKGTLKVEEKEVRYKMMIHKEIDVFIKEHIPNYHLLVFIFNRINDYIYIENSNVVFRTRAMLDLIESNKRIYDFSNLKIE